jgi:hypothetical protein
MTTASGRWRNPLKRRRAAGFETAGDLLDQLRTRAEATAAR